MKTLCLLAIIAVAVAADTSGRYNVQDNSGRYVPDSGQYVHDNSGQYYHDNSGQYVPDNSGQYYGENSGRYNPQSATRFASVHQFQNGQQCEPNGTPCQFDGGVNHVWTNCCSGYCYQEVGQAWGVCANQGGSLH